MEKYIIWYHIGVFLGNINEITYFLEAGWRPVEYTPTDVIFEKAFEVNRDIHSIKLIPQLGYTVDAIYSAYPYEIIYTQKRGWLTE